MIRFDATRGKFHHRAVTRDIARPYFHRLPPHRAHGAGGFTPLELAARYQYPAGFDGTGQTIFLLELGGGVDLQSLIPYWAQLGIKPPQIEIFTLPGAVNQPGSDADGEVCLDICVAAAMAPGAKIVVGFGQNSDTDFAALIRAAVDQCGATVISISWGGPEDSWPSTSQQNMRQAIQYANSKGAMVCVASGDNDSGDGESGDHVDFPASCPESLACGGTFIEGQSEVCWNSGPGEGTGGGFSAVYLKQGYQSDNSDPRRMVSDVAGDADPASGWIVSVNGSMQSIGGTSAVAPAWAALIARLQQALKRAVPIGELYAAAPTFTRITAGNNGDFPATVCCGLGVPNGEKLLAALQGTAPAPSPTPPPPPTPTPVPNPLTFTAAQVSYLRQDLRTYFATDARREGWLDRMANGYFANGVDQRFTELPTS